LERFEEQKLVSRLEVDGKPVFLLNQPLQNFKQQVEISGMTAGKIANVVNSWLKENGKADYLVNPLDGITEWSIQVLLHIAETALAQTNWIAVCGSYIPLCPALKPDYNAFISNQGKTEPQILFIWLKLHSII
jgi:hypothetical protein